MTTFRLAPMDFPIRLLTLALLVLPPLFLVIALLGNRMRPDELHGRVLLVERRSERPWLVTPERPEAFVRALST